MALVCVTSSNSAADYLGAGRGSRRVVASERLAYMVGCRLEPCARRCPGTVVDQDVIVTQPDGYTLGSVTMLTGSKSSWRRRGEAAPVEALAASIRRCDDAVRVRRYWWTASTPSGRYPLQRGLLRNFVAWRSRIAGRRRSHGDATRKRLRRWLPRQPCTVCANRPVERALVAQGRQTEALREIRGHIDEVGVEPGDQLVDLDAEVRDGLARQRGPSAQGSGWRDASKATSGQRHRCGSRPRGGRGDRRNWSASSCHPDRRRRCRQDTFGGRIGTPIRSLVRWNVAGGTRFDRAR